MSFFDDDRQDDDLEEPTHETRRARGRGVKRVGSGGPRRPPGGGAAVLRQPAVRILIALAILVVVILIIVQVVQSCQRSQLVDSYKRYLNGANGIATESADQGSSLRTLLQNKKGRKPVEIEKQIAALAQGAQGLVDRARKLDPPGRLRTPNQSFIQALQYRQLALSKLPKAVDAGVGSPDPANAAATIALPLSYASASDTVYQLSYQNPGKEALVKDNIKGYSIDNSAMLPGITANYGTPIGARPLVRAMNAAGRGSGQKLATGTAHGTALSKVFVDPSGVQLVNGGSNEIKAANPLKWRVIVEDTGAFEERGIAVKSTLKNPNSPGQDQVETATVEDITPGPDNAKTVTLDGPTTPVFGQAYSLTIDVQTVPGEQHAENNSGTYSVTFQP